MDDSGTDLDTISTPKNEKRKPEKSWFERTHHLVLAYSTLALAITTLVLAYATWRLQAEIEDTRAHTSIDLLLTAVDKLGNGAHCAHFLVDISDEEVKDIFKQKSLKINPKDLDLLNSCLAGTTTNENKLFDSSKNILTVHGSSYIVSQIEHDMNLLNIVAAAYYSGSSNKKIIKETIDNLMTLPAFKTIIDKSEQNYYSTYLYRFIAEDIDYVPKTGNGKQD